MAAILAIQDGVKNNVDLLGLKKLKLFAYDIQYSSERIILVLYAVP